jgi:RHS repeat-associated protein
VFLNGANTPRQLTNSTGEVTLVSSYTPWGDTLSVAGTGSFTQGYFGGVMDTATGLLYVGNGQYYDPETGRFLNRNAKPEQNNPYIPWGGNPSSALIAPLALLVLVFGRKKTRSKWDNLVIVTVLCLVVGMGLAACDPGTKVITTPDGTTAVITPLPNETVAVAVTLPGESTKTFVLTPLGTPKPPCPPIPTTGTPFDPKRADETIFGKDERKDAFLQAVLRHQNELPAGMTVPLLLAMGSAEKGVCSDWSQVNDPCNPGNADGILQLSPDNEWRYKSGYAYNDT